METPPRPQGPVKRSTYSSPAGNAPLEKGPKPILLRLHHYRPIQWPFSSSASVVPSAAGLGETTIPADFIASIFERASPLPPEMIAHGVFLHLRALHEPAGR